MRDLPLTEARLFAMGSTCRIVADVASRDVEQAVHRLNDLEQRWSRFLPGSEVSELNAAAGSDPTPVSAVTELLLRRSTEAMARTAGRFDPFRLNDLIRSGYCGHRRATASTPEVVADDLDCDCARTAADLETGWVDDDLFTAEGVLLPSGIGFDPGGVGKGLAADLLAEQLLHAGASWIVVSLGGDMRVAGAAIAELGIEVKIDDPLGEGTLGALRVVGGGVASSSVRRRRWTDPTGPKHHLVDPVSGTSAVTSRAAVTVAAAEAWWADCVASILTIDDGLDAGDAQRFEVEAIAVTHDGEIEDLRMDELQPIGHTS